MSFTVVDVPQRSPEWFAARAGRLTGSKAWLVADFLKGGKESAARRDYRMQLVCERLTGQPEESGDGFMNAAMQRGVELEPKAFAAYEALTGNIASRSGFLSHDTVMAGCSLDGYIDQFKGLLEIKCPKTATHVHYLRGTAVVPADHLPQVVHSFWVTGAEWCDFLSYDDRLPEALQTFLVRVRREDVNLSDYAAAAVKFLAEVNTEADALRTMTKGWAG